MQKFVPFYALWACVLLLVAGWGFTSCSDDEEPFLPTLPARGGSNVRSITHLGSVPSCYDWQFTYAGKRLSKAQGVVRDPSPAIDQSYKYNSALSYQAHGVRIKNSNNEKTNVVLNAQGYIQSMTVNRNIYNFVYNPEGRLIAWNKIVFEDSFGQAQQYRTSASIEYENGNFSRIVYISTDKKPVILTFTPSTWPNFNGLLPSTATLELGCLGFEHLYYAGLLGISTENLVQSISYEFENSEKNYQTKFEYSLKGGNVVLCNYHTADGSAASVSYGY